MKTVLLRVTLLMLFSASTVLAQKPAVFSVEGKAIREYDPVAYFTDGKATAGNTAFTYSHQDATYQLASQQHLDAFKADPEKYAPQYSGYCAYGLSRGYKATTNSDAWTIDGVKLCLNYDTKVRSQWDKDRTGYIEKANQNWPGVKTGK